MNADNLAADRVVYVASTGAVDFASLILSMTLLKFFGRKISSCGLFALAGIFLLSLIVIPRGVLKYIYSFFRSIVSKFIFFLHVNADNTHLVVIFAMAGRFGITAVYSIITRMFKSNAI